MKKLSIIVFLVLSFGISINSFADECGVDDYACLCEGNYINLGNVDDLVATITMYQINGVRVGDDYLLCFDNSKNIIFDTILPEFRDHVILFGMTLSFWRSVSTLQTYGNLSIVNSWFVGISNNPLSIRGSNVEVVDSIIETKRDGISIIGFEERPTENVTIKNSEISGPRSFEERSSGVDIYNYSSDIHIIDSTIEHFDVGINGPAYVEDMKFSYVNTLINNGASPVNTEKIARTELYDGYKIDLLGSISLEECDEDPIKNGYVDLYKDRADNTYEMRMSCSVFPLENNLSAGCADDDLCGDQEIMFERGDCVFKCEGIPCYLAFYAKFVYVGEFNIAYQESDRILTGYVPIFAPHAPVATYNAPAYSEGEENFINDETETHQPSETDETSAEVTTFEEGDSENFESEGPLSSLITPVAGTGCSVSRLQEDNKTWLILIFTLLIFIAKRSRCQKY